MDIKPCYKKVNGEWVKQNVYKMEDGAWKCLSSGKLLDLWRGDDCTISEIKYINGYWVACGSRIEDVDGSKVHYGCIAYTTDIDGTWIIRDLWSSRGVAEVMSITYAEGYWVVGGTCLLPDTTYDDSDRIAYATSFDGEWTIKTLHTYDAAGGYCRVYTVKYLNGYWVATGRYGSGSSVYNAYIAYTTDINGSWTTKTIWSGYYVTNNVIADIIYENGKWVVSGSRCPAGWGTANQTHLKYTTIAYSTSLNGTWTIKNLWSSYTVTNLARLVYENGYWVVNGVYKSDTTGLYYVRIAYSTLLDGTWTTKDLWCSTGSNDVYSSGVAYKDGYWVVCGSARDGWTPTSACMAYSDTLDGIWVKRILWTGTSYNNMAYCMEQVNNRWVFGGMYDKSSVRTKSRIIKFDSTEELMSTDTSIVGTWIINDSIEAPTIEINLTNIDGTLMFNSLNIGNGDADLKELTAKNISISTEGVTINSSDGYPNSQVTLSYNTDGTKLNTWEAAYKSSSNGHCVANLNSTSKQTQVRTLRVTKDTLDENFVAWLKYNAVKIF